jgi:hypothetical protein
MRKGWREREAGLEGAMGVDGKLKQEAADCVAQTARLSKAPGERQ